MTSLRYGASCATILATLMMASPAFAQLKIHVPVGNMGSPTARGTAYATQELKQIPGGAAVVPAEDFQETYALSMKDMLKATPGVMAQPRWGEESRLSIRGSGLSRGFHMRGITLLQDGVPFTFADGSSDFQEIDPLILQHLEVYRGGQGLRYGAATLGGAINMVTPTARTLDYNGLLRAEAGSFGTVRLHGQAAKVFGDTDAFVSTTRTISDGFRNQSEQNNLRFAGNTGVRLGHNAETRFYVAWNDIEQEVPGTISKKAAQHNPKSVPAINISGDYARDVHSLRLANKTAFMLDNGFNVEVGAYANKKSLYHPIFEVIDQDSLDLGTFARLTGDYALGTQRHSFIMGINAGRGVNDAKRFTNISGKRGALRYDAKQIAQNVELYGENRWHFMPQWSLLTGLQGTIAYRDYTDNRNSNNNDDETYQSLNPKIGVLWNVSPDTEIYTSLTRSSEAPTYSEMVQGAVPGLVPVDLQTAWTAEIGTRGKYGAFSWDATLYHTRVKNELLNYTVSPDVPASTFNADKTVHQGIELGAGWQVTDTLSFQGIYNLNDFYFDGDDQYGDNDLAGAPRHQVRVSARYEQNGFFVEPNIEWTPQAAYVDYANTLEADESLLTGMSMGYAVNDRVSFFLDGRNLTNEKTTTSFSTITDARNVGTNVFYPADGRSVFGGIKVKF